MQFPPHCSWRPPALDCGAQGLAGRVSVGNLGADMSAVLVRVRPMQGEVRSYTLTTGSPAASILGGAPTWDTWREVGITYANIGVDHILLGFDHLLFVLGLIWLVPGGWRLFKTITAFTVGHSISLALAAYGVVGVAERPLNACIALSIVFLAVEIVNKQRGRDGLTVRFPWAVAGGFGLVHGIGFASALSNLGIERDLLFPALLAFNLGVEAGQVAFVLVVLALFWAHRAVGAGPDGAGRQTQWLALAPAYGIGAVSMFWFLGRMARIVAA